MAYTEVGKLKLLEVLYEAMAEVNLELLDEDQLALDPSTALFGEAAALDSMDLVRLVVLYEQKLNELLGMELSLTDDRAMSEENSPFQTVASLVDYVKQLLEVEQILKEEANAG